jgi:hypothetical protein
VWHYEFGSLYGISRTQHQEKYKLAAILFTQYSSLNTDNFVVYGPHHEFRFSATHPHSLFFLAGKVKTFSHPAPHTRWPQRSGLPSQAVALLGLLNQPRLGTCTNPCHWKIHLKRVILITRFVRHTVTLSPAGPRTSTTTSKYLCKWAYDYIVWKNDDVIVTNSFAWVFFYLCARSSELPD